MDFLEKRVPSRFSKKCKVPVVGMSQASWKGDLEATRLETEREAPSGS